MQKSQLAPLRSFRGLVPACSSWRAHQHSLQFADHGVAVETSGSACLTHAEYKVVYRSMYPWGGRLEHASGPASLEGTPDGRFSHRIRDHRSEFHMGTERRYNHRSAVAVVSGIIDVLHTGRHINSAPDVCRVVGLHDGLAAIVQAAIAEQKTQSAGRQIILVIFFDGIGHKSHASAILLAMPPCTIRAHTTGHSLIYLGVGEGLGLTIIPTDAGEAGEVASEILFDVEPEAVLAGD